LLATVVSMPRPPRIIDPGGIYHLISRGNDGRVIFTTNADRERFLKGLDTVVERYNWVVFGYCLMDNHVHLLVQVPEDGISAGMRDLLGGYARWWNHKHGHSGHLFRNRFWDRHVQDDWQLLATACYIDLNPVRANLKRRPEQWIWSSYRAHAGLVHPLKLLASAEFMKRLAPTPDMARTAYTRFVTERRTAVSDTAVRAHAGAGALGSAGSGGATSGSGRGPRRALPP
jgi:putative transposase